MVKLMIKSMGSDPQYLEVSEGTNLMTALQSEGLVEGTCGGSASCGTCHIYFADAKVAGERTEDEGYMLEGLEEYVKVKEGSRLSCQVQICADHEGISIEIAPEV